MHFPNNQPKTKIYTMNNILTEKELLILTQALNDLADYKDISYKQAKEILEKIKSRQGNIFKKGN